MPGWGQSWTDNKMFKLAEEKRRQQAVVKKFIADHPEYDPKNDYNNKALVDLVEASERPFTSETIEWAYAKMLEPLIVFKNIPTALNNTNMSEYYYKVKRQVKLETKPEPVYDKTIEPTETVRRIKDDNDD